MNQPITTMRLKHSCSGLGLLSLCLVLLAACGVPENEKTPPIHPVQDANGVSLGSVALPDFCSPEVQDRLRRGVALLHNMTFLEAEKQFRSAMESDPQCSIAHWGVAMSYVHPLWPDVPSVEQFEDGAAHLEHARASQETLHEAAYINALAAYYDEWDVRSEAERLQTYFDGWDTAHTQFPRDLESKLFRAVALTAVASSSENREQMQVEAGEQAQQVLDKVPDHTGAMHYIIHAYDLPQLASRALPVARVYGEVASGNAHALHMTSHIFTRVGLWEESIKYNHLSAENAIHDPINGHVSYHYLHAADYLVFALLQSGRDEEAKQVWKEMRSFNMPISNSPASAYAYAAVPVRLALERGKWAEATKVQAGYPSSLPWVRYPQFVAIQEYGRGLGFAQTKNKAAALRSADALAALAKKAASLPGAYDWGTQVVIQEKAVRALVAYRSGSVEKGLAQMKEASDLEASTTKNPVTPGEVLPVAELYGQMLLESNKAGQALEAFNSALSRSPNRLNSLFGAGQAAEKMGNMELAREFYQKLLDASDPASKHAHVVYARGQVSTT